MLRYLSQSNPLQRYKFYYNIPYLFPSRRVSSRPSLSRKYLRRAAPALMYSGFNRFSTQRAFVRIVCFRSARGNQSPEAVKKEHKWSRETTGGKLLRPFNGAQFGTLLRQIYFIHCRPIYITVDFYRFGTGVVLFFYGGLTA